MPNVRADLAALVEQLEQLFDGGDLRIDAFFYEGRNGSCLFERLGGFHMILSYPEVLASSRKLSLRADAVQTKSVLPQVRSQVSLTLRCVIRDVKIP